MAIFPTFFLGNIGQENVFNDILDRKNAFLSYKNKKFKKSKNWHFSKGVNTWFWSKNGHFLNLYFLGNIGQENVLKGKNAKNSPFEGKNCTEFILKGFKLKRIHPQKAKNTKNSPLKVKIAENFSLKGKKCKESTLKGWKMRRIHPQKVKNAKNWPSKVEKWKEFTLKQWKLQRINP